MIPVLKQLFIFYIFIVIGWIIGKSKKDAASKSAVLSVICVNVFLPCKVIQNFSTEFTMSYLKNNYVTIIISVSILAILVVLAKIGSRFLTKNPYERKVYDYSLTITNYAYMGYVLVESLLGVTALTNIILFCIPFSIYTNTVGYAMLTGNGKSWKKVLNAPTIAIFVGMFFGLTGIQLPEVITKVINMSSACMGPVSMLLVGLVISTFTLRELLPKPRVMIFMLLRLIVLPLAVFGICKGLSLIFTLPPAVYPSAVIVAAMPCGLNTVVFPRLVGEDCKPGAQLTLYSHLFLCASLPLWLLILTK